MVTKHQADQLIWSGIQQQDDSFRKLFVQKGADEKVVDDLQRYLFEVHGPIVGYIYTETDECQLLTGRAQAYFKKYPDKLSRLLDMSREFMADGCVAFPIVEDTIDLFDIESVSLKKANRVSEQMLAQQFHRQMLILSYVEEAFRAAGLTSVFLSASDELTDAIASHGYEYNIEDVVSEMTAPIAELKYHES